MQKPHDNSKVCRAAFVQDSTLVVVIEMALTSWLVAGMIPGVDREPLKKIAPDPEELLQLLYRWRDEAIKAGKEITRIAVALIFAIASAECVLRLMAAPIFALVSVGSVLLLRAALIFALVLAERVLPRLFLCPRRAASFGGSNVACTQFRPRNRSTT